MWAAVWGALQQAVSTDWAVIASLALSVFMGGVAMAWRLGRLEQKVADLTSRIHDLNRAPAGPRPSRQAG